MVYTFCKYTKKTGDFYIPGAFLDPYSFEWEDEYEVVGHERRLVDYKRLAIDRFREIINIKRANPNRVTLLIGNHDCGYCIGLNICTCRMDYKNAPEITHLFQDNRELFQIGKRIEVNGKTYDLTHSGIFKDWAKRVWGDEAEADDFNVIDRLNNAWLTEDYKILDRLEEYDYFRGWGGVEHASPVWADVRAWIDVPLEETYNYNIVGHTMTDGTPVIMEAIADIDCKKAFYIDDKGILRDYMTDEEPEETPIQRKK